ncbi:relaxase/mobilization nuclease domain-containing protein [Thalassococcus sp. S3]|uniref:relaxase/mobilization nuclease domain-containing protein n=1 Tax=Thalassococcus sp. S3 TaxID=2017482 RepID=UPI001024914A|nr:relaxase/mobilization nuclease domain-containing protein [Thalassococcus sp. S3]QBF30772.1 mobilization relaxase [Thalassococcus sp. S3]
MLIKFFPNGKGGGAGPVEYLTARTVLAYDDNRDLMRDAAGQPMIVTRDPLPEVVRGDADVMIDLIDACPYKWTYRAGVVSFAREDAPTEDQQQEVIDRFEEIAFAGLDADRYACLWVRHTHEDRVELHFCTPRMELHSGRSLNIAPPGYERTFDSLRDLMNKTHGWADPMDVVRSAEVKTVTEAPTRAQGRDELHGWVRDQISLGLITDRAVMTEALKEAGFEVPRAGKNYLTVKDPDTGERWRLKGEIFNEDWTADTTSEQEAEGGYGADESRECRLDRYSVAELQERFEDHCRKRACYNQDRYGRVSAAREETSAEAECERGASGMDGDDLSSADRLRADDQQLAFDLDGSELADTQHAVSGDQDDRAARSDVLDPFPGYDDADPLPPRDADGRLPEDRGAVSDGWPDSVRTRIAELRGAVDRSVGNVRAGFEGLRAAIGQRHPKGTRILEVFDEFAGAVARVTRSVVASLDRATDHLRTAVAQAGGEREASRLRQDGLGDQEDKRLHQEEQHGLRH